MEEKNDKKLTSNTPEFISGVNDAFSNQKIEEIKVKKPKKEKKLKVDPYSLLDNPENNVKKLKEMSKRKTKTQRYTLGELEDIQEKSIKKTQFRTKRNRVTIIVLSCLLAVSICVLVALLVLSYLSHNTFLHVHGCRADYYVNGVEKNMFRTPIGLTGDRTLKVDVDIEIKSSGLYNVRFVVLVFKDGEKLEGTRVAPIYGNEESLFKDTGNHYEFVSIDEIRGRQTIHLFEGISIDDQYENTLNSDNIRIEVHTYFNRIR